MEEKIAYQTEVERDSAQRLPVELQYLVGIRNRIQRAKEELVKARMKMEATYEYANLKSIDQEVVELKDIERMQMEKVRSLAVNLYQQNHNKSVLPGVSIRVTRTLEYDKKAAKDWALANLPNAITVDTSLFERHALAVADTAPIPCVEIIETPTATIATKLPGQE